MSKQFYITTAIDYANGKPHLGHAYEKVVADVIARVQRSIGDQVFFLTGLDEHGQKVQQAAAAEGLSPQVFCDQLSESWRALAGKLGLSNQDFIRTTEPRHQRVVRAILSRLHAAGHFYRAPYLGFYSKKEETFLTDKDRRPDGTFDPIYGDVVEVKEENYYFRIQQHQGWLIDYLENQPHFITPANRRNEVLGWLKNHPLEDLCITRPAARLSWGIPLPFDPEFVTYVWFDALVNYISVPASMGDAAVNRAIGFPEAALPSVSLWPANLHVIGKDILKFHAVYWPIMLKALGLPLPLRLVVHGFWQKDGERLSKSTGNVVDPFEVIDAWGLDAFRYYVVRELDLGPDGNWTDAGFQARYTAELANGLGNLVNRSLSMLQRYRSGVVPSRSQDLSEEVMEKVSGIFDFWREHRLQSALQAIWRLVDRGNQYVDQTAPFKLAKIPEQGARLDEVLYSLTELCRILAILLWPALPSTAENIFKQLGLTGTPDQLRTAVWGGLAPGHLIGTPQALFPRKDVTAPPKK